MPSSALRNSLISASAGLLLAFASAFAQPQPAFAVAEVRADGLLLPVAKWDGTGWHALKLTRSDSVPYFAPGEWHYVAFSGARARLVPGPAVAILTDDYDHWGFTTDLAVRRFDSPPHLSQRVGVATSDSVPLQLFVAATPRERSLARAAMRRLLDSAWKAMLDSARKEGKQPAWAPPPAADSFVFSARVVRLSNGTTLMNAFARLPVSSLAQVPTCAILTAYDGFVVIRGERVLVQKSPVITDCDMKELKAEDPLALFRLAGRTFVLARQVGWEERAPAIYEWRDSQLSLVFQRDP